MLEPSMAHNVAILARDVVVCDNLAVFKKIAGVRKPVSHKGERDQIPSHPYIQAEACQEVNPLEEFRTLV